MISSYGHQIQETRLATFHCFDELKIPNLKTPAVLLIPMFRLVLTKLLRVHVTRLTNFVMVTRTEVK